MYTCHTATAVWLFICDGCNFCKREIIVMAKNKQTLPEDEILWKDRKRILGMPISFTVYQVTKDRLISRVGFFKTEIDEILLYRIMDIKLTRTLGQKIFGVGTITLYSADKSDRKLFLINVKKPEAVRTFLSKHVENVRNEKGIIGREVFGNTNTNVGFGDDVQHDYVDLDGDGIPD